VGGRIKTWRLKFKVDKLALPTDEFRGVQPPRPGDSIYWTAQWIPAVSGFIDCLLIYKGSDFLTSDNNVRLAMTIMAGIVSVGIVVILSRRAQSPANLV
jgi:hypothetical protein